MESDKDDSVSSEPIPGTSSDSSKETQATVDQPKQALLKRKGTPRGKHISVSIKQKLDILEELEMGSKIKDVAAKYNIGLTTVYDIKKAKKKLQEYQRKLALVGNSETLTKKRRLVTGKVKTIDESVLEWYQQHQSVGLPVRGVDLQVAAEMFAGYLNVPDFQASNGWLFRFKNRHGLANRRICGEALNPDAESVELEPVKDFETNEPFVSILKSCGEGEVREWLEDEEVHGHHPKSEEEISADVSGSTEDMFEEEDEVPALPKLKISRARDAIEDLLKFTEDCDLKEVQKYYTALRGLRQEIINIQYTTKKLKVIPD